MAFVSREKRFREIQSLTYQNPTSDKRQERMLDFGVSILGRSPNSAFWYCLSEGINSYFSSSTRGLNEIMFAESTVLGV